VYGLPSMSSRTKVSCAFAFARISVVTASQRSSRMSCPSAVSLTETLASSFRRAISSRSARYCAPVSRASASFVNDSPRRSSVAVIPFAFNSATASQAVAIVSPATKREANRFASPLCRTKRKIPGWRER